MIAPPHAIDGAIILKIADLAGVEATGRTRHVVKGEQAEDFSALAIAQYDSAPGFYLFYCDVEWRTVTDTYHDTIEGAIAQAEFEFGKLDFVDPSG